MTSARIIPCFDIQRAATLLFIKGHFIAGYASRDGYRTANISIPNRIENQLPLSAIGKPSVIIPLNLSHPIESEKFVIAPVDSSIIPQELLQNIVEQFYTCKNEQGNISTESSGPPVFWKQDEYILRINKQNLMEHGLHAALLDTDEICDLLGIRRAPAAEVYRQLQPHEAAPLPAPAAPDASQPKIFGGALSSLNHQIRPFTRHLAPQVRPLVRHIQPLERFIENRMGLEHDVASNKVIRAFDEGSEEPRKREGREERRAGRKERRKDRNWFGRKKEGKKHKVKGGEQMEEDQESDNDDEISLVISVRSDAASL